MLCSVVAYFDLEKKASYLVYTISICLYSLEPAHTYVLAELDLFMCYELVYVIISFCLN